jgi:acetylornithine deacetylase
MNRALQGPELYEHQVTAYLESYFRALGVRFERQQVAPLRDNIVAYSDFPGRRPTLLLEAHQDTIAVDNMRVEPFAAEIVDGRLFGRGACDVKGGMAAMLVAFARLMRERPHRACNLIMACTVDEEHTFLGVQRLMRGGLEADMAVVAEPTSLRIVNAHKGVVRWHIETSGRACHSSAPEQGVNAIYRMAPILNAVHQYADELQASKRDPVLGAPTLSIGRIEGGSSVNTVPDHCRIEIDRRLLPGESAKQAPHDLAMFIRRLVGDTVPFESSQPWLIAPALGSEHSARLVEKLGEAINAVKGEHQVIAVPYGTDASTIAEAGIPAVVFGPGDIAQAHTCDEWISLTELDAASDILYRLACDQS